MLSYHEHLQASKKERRVKEPFFIKYAPFESSSLNTIYSNNESLLRARQQIQMNDHIRLQDE